MIGQRDRRMPNSPATLKGAPPAPCYNAGMAKSTLYTIAAIVSLFVGSKALPLGDRYWSPEELSYFGIRYCVAGVSLLACLWCLAVARFCRHIEKNPQASDR